MAVSDNEMEFWSYLDDAWYIVRAVRDGEEKLRVKYTNFPEYHNEIFEASKFDSVKKLQEFRCRFRPVSLQLQDAECSKVVEGLHLCASNTFDGSDIRFYDFVDENADSPWHFTDDGVNLLTKGPTGEQIFDFVDKISERFDFVVHKKGVYNCFTNKSPYHGHFALYEQQAKNEHIASLMEQIAKLVDALYNIQFEQHWLDVQTDRQAISEG